MFTDEPAMFEIRTPFGLPVRFGASLVLLALVVVPLADGPAAFALGLVIFALLVASILVHELAHAWAAQIQGLPVRRIAVHAGGGHSIYGRPASRYEAELIVAIGPAANLAIWAVAGLAAGVVQPGALGWTLSTLSQINLFVALFSLLPAMPLDGGKLLQLVLLRVVDAPLATRINGCIGLVLSLLWIPLLVASFVWTGLVLFVLPPVSAHWLMVRQPMR